MEVERERAKQRQLSGKPLDLQIPESEGQAVGQARDAVGTALGVSGKQVDNLLTVKQAVDTLRAAPASSQL